MNPISFDPALFDKKLAGCFGINLAHAEQLLCDATLSGCPYVDLGLDEAFSWWEKCLEDFSDGGYPIDPLMPKGALERVSQELKQARQVYQWIAEGEVDLVLQKANDALARDGSRFLIPIVYKSQSSGKLEALFAEFTREQGKLYVRLLNRGEGMRLHALLEVRDGKRLYSYCTEKMELADQEMFAAAEFGRAWVKQLKGFQIDSTLPEEIYGVFRNVLTGNKIDDLRHEMASSPQRSATSLHHLPRILFRHYELESPERLKRLSFAVKARALFQVLGTLRAGGAVDALQVREEIAELHASAAKLRGFNILDDEDLQTIHLMTDTLLRELPRTEVAATVSTSCEGANKVWNFDAPTPRKLWPRGKPHGPPKINAANVSRPRGFRPEPKKLLQRLQSLTEELDSTRIAEMHEVFLSLPLPGDEYWDQIEACEREKILSAMRILLQCYGSKLDEMEKTEVPRAILSVATAYCIADGLARRLEGDPLKLQNYGLWFPKHDELFFFHKRVQSKKWRAIQEYFKDGDVFRYRRGPVPWSVFQNRQEDGHLKYLRQFDKDLSPPQMIARRFLQENEKPLDGLKMPQSYDDLHYFAATLRRLCAEEDLGVSLRCDQIPVLLKYYDEKEKYNQYELIYCNAEKLPTEIVKNFHQKEESIQKRQTGDYSKEAEKVFFPENLHSENQLMHAGAALGNLPQGAIHALQKLLRLKNPSDYPLCISELIDFCLTYPSACRHPDVRVAIEHVLLKEGALYKLLRAEGGLEKLQQIQGFLRNQRLSVAGLESRLEEYLFWQRLSLDVEQLAPEVIGILEELIEEVAQTTASLELNVTGRADLAMHRAYLYSFYPGMLAELLRYWIEARTLRRQIKDSSPSWMEGEILRTIQVQGPEYQNALEETVELLSSFLPGCNAWSKNGNLFECNRGIDHFVLDPFGGYVYCNGIPYGTPPDSPTSTMCANVRTLLNLEKTPELVQGADQVWRLASDPSLCFESRDRFEHRELSIPNDPRTRFSVYKVEDTWLLPEYLRKSGNSFFCQEYLGGFLVVEEPDGSRLVVYNGMNYSNKRETFWKYYSKKECKFDLYQIEGMRDEVIGAFKKQLTYLAIREFENARWQRAMENRAIPAELLIGHTAWIECDCEKPRILLLDAAQKPAIMLTPGEQGYLVRKLSTGAERVELNCMPWSQLGRANEIIAWAKEGVLDEVSYPKLGLHFIRRENRFECLQLPGFYAQGPSQLPCQLVLENDAGERRMLLLRGNSYSVCTHSGGRWKIPDNATGLHLILKMLEIGDPLGAMTVLDQIGEEQPLQLSDWERLAQLTQIKNASHGIGALILQLALRVTELKDQADPKKSLAAKLKFWSAVDLHLAAYGQDQSVPLIMQLSERQLCLLRNYPRPQPEKEQRYGSPWGVANELHHARRYMPGGYQGTPLPEFCGHWTRQQLGGNLPLLEELVLEQKQFPAPLDLQLQATIEREQAGIWAYDEYDRLRLGLLQQLRNNRKPEDLKKKPPIETTRGKETAPSKPLQMQNGPYDERPFAALITQENKALPKENVDVKALLPQSPDPLAESVRAPLRDKLNEPTKTEVPCFRLKEGAKVALAKAIVDQQSLLQRLKQNVEELASASITLAQRSRLLSPQYPRITVEEVLILLNPENPKGILERNPFLSPEELDKLLHTAIDYMECGWKISQLTEALSDEAACADILNRKQTFNPHSCWWRSLYQYMSGNMLRSDPDQSAILEKIFAILDGEISDPSGGLLQQLYFEFQAGGGKTKVLSAIAALRCLSRKKTPVFFSLPNLVDICKRDLRSALADYFHKRTEYIGLSLSSTLSNADLQELLERLERQKTSPACFVMIPEGYHLLNLEYWKALGTRGCGQRVELLDKILSFFEEQATFLIDEGHRNKDSLLNANIAVGQPYGIPAVYRAMHRIVYDWLVQQPELALQQNGQAALSPEARDGIIRRLLEYMLALPSLNVPEELREELITKYLLDKTTEPPAWLANKKDQLQAQWIAQLRGLATTILPFTLGLKGMIDHGPSIHPTNEVEAPRDHGQLSAAKFELPDIALGLTYQGFLQRGLTKEEQFEEVLEQLRNQPETDEELFLSWQKGLKIPLAEIRPGALNSRLFQQAFQNLRNHPEVILRYVAGRPAGQVSVFQHRLLSTAAALSYGAAQAITFSATLGMRSQYTYFGDNSGYCEDTDFLVKVIRKAMLDKNSRVEIDHSQTPKEFVTKNDFKDVASFLDFGGACGARPSHEWSRAFLEEHKELDGTLYAQQQVDKDGNIGEKLLYLHMRGKEPTCLTGSDTKSLLKSPELQGKNILRLFGPEDTVGLDLYAKPDASFVITIGENCCLDDLAQALLRARFFLVDTPDGEPSQTVRWIVHEKIAKQIKSDGKITVQDILRFALANLEKRLKEAIQTRAYQEIEAVYTRRLRVQLRGKNGAVQQAQFDKCIEAVYKKMGYDPFEEWGGSCEEKATRDVLTAFDQKLKAAYSAVLKEEPQWASKRIEAVISETERLLKTMPIKRGNDLQARQIQKQHAHTQQRGRTRQQQRQRAAKQQPGSRWEASLCSKELAVENLKNPLDHDYLRPACKLFDSELLPKNLLLTRDTVLTHAAGNTEDLWKPRTMKPLLHVLVLKAKDQEPLYIGLSQDQARAYLEQLQLGKRSPDFEIGLLDIRRNWSFPMQDPPKDLSICHAISLLNGRIHDPAHLREIAKYQVNALQKLWTQLEQLHLDPIPSWETVLACISTETDPLQAMAKTVDQLRIALPKGAPNLPNEYKEIPQKRKLELKVVQKVPAKQPSPLNLPLLRAQMVQARVIPVSPPPAEPKVEPVAPPVQPVREVRQVERVVLQPSPARPARNRCWQNLSLGAACAIGVALAAFSITYR